jgi:hypothetical protein
VNLDHERSDFEQLAERFAESWATGEVDQALEQARAASTHTHGWNPPLQTPWPPIEQYILSEACPRCGARRGEECVVRAGGLRFHLQRSDRGGRHYRRDIRRSPWREDRVPGRRYDSLSDDVEIEP